MALNNVLTEDLNSLLASEIEWSNFKDKRILVTGATGLVGSMVVDIDLRKRKIRFGS